MKTLIEITSCPVLASELRKGEVLNWVRDQNSEITWMGLLHNTVVSLKVFFQGRELIVDKAGQATEETWVRSLGQEDPLEKGMANHSRILAWRIPWTEQPGGLQSWGHRELDILSD